MFQKTKNKKKRKEMRKTLDKEGRFVYNTRPRTQRPNRVC